MLCWTDKRVLIDLLGWLVSGVFTLITCAISGYAVWTHARNYRKP